MNKGLSEYSGSPRRKWPWLRLAPLFAVLIFVVNAAGTDAAGEGGAAAEPGAASVPGIRPQEFDAERERSRPVPPARKNPKLSSHLSRLIEANEQAKAAGEGITARSVQSLPPDLGAMVQARLLRMDDLGFVQVYVHPATAVESGAAAVEAAGGAVELVDAEAAIVQARVPIGSLQGLKADPAVQLVRLPDYGVSQAGSVTTQGDSILRANLARSTFGIDGTGVRVGVISDGVGGIGNSQASGDLPPSVNTTTCNIGPGNPQSNGAEGTAMLEIVHDLAPGAELWFGDFDFGTSVQFMAAVDCLAANTDVVVDDIAWFNAGAYDGTSSVSANASAELNRASNRIRAYANAVGNEAQRHYEEPFNNSGFTLESTWQLHRFQATTSTSDAGSGLRCTPSLAVFCGDTVTVANGGSVLIFLQWNDPFGSSANDYDLFLFDVAAPSAPVTLSTDEQSGFQDPVEALGWLNNSGSTKTYAGVIGKFSGTDRAFDMFVLCSGCFVYPNNAVHNFNTPSSSVPGNSDAGGGVVSAGAINAAEPGNDSIAAYSSRGPTNDGRMKPDITGIDGVSITGAGGFPNPFFGTSAAAPHIGGIAALLLQGQSRLMAGEPGDNPPGDRACLRDALLANAADVGSPGPDNTYGSGRVDALSSAESLLSGITCPFSWSPFQTWPGYGLQSGSWQTGDFNGDGRTDLVHLCCGDYANLWLAQPGGNFALSIFPLWPGYGMQSGSWQSGDFNGDTKTDLVHLCCGNYANLWLAQPGGNFALSIFPLWPGYGMQSGSWLTGDFNGDEKTDLVHLCCGDYANLWLAKQTGDGFTVSVFNLWPGYGMQSGSWLAGDFNGDNKTDLVHLCCGEYANLWLAQPGGAFAPSIFKPWPGYGMQSGSWRMGDFNDDGKTDLVHLCCGDYGNLWLSQLPASLTMAIDMNTAGNFANTIGKIERCARINENGVQDADEDVVDGLIIDVTAQNIPGYNDGGTPGQPADDSGGIIGFDYSLSYSSANLTLNADDPNFLLAANTGSSVLNLSEPVPDDAPDADDVWNGAALDTVTTSVPESGDGVLHRLTLVSESAAVAGIYPLTLTNNFLVDIGNSQIPPQVTLPANVAINQACS